MKLSPFLLISFVIHLAVLLAWPGLFGVTRAAQVQVQQGLSVLEISLPRVITVKEAQPEPVPAEELNPPEPEPEVMPQPAVSEAEPVPTEAEKEPARENDPQLSATGSEGVVTGAVMIGQTRPKYPRMSRIRAEEGRVDFEAVINAEGRCASVKLIISSGYERLDQSALTWVRRARYIPARRGDTGVDWVWRDWVSFELLRKDRQ
jgi:protein TonB